MLNLAVVSDLEAKYFYFSRLFFFFFPQKIILEVCEVVQGSKEELYTKITARISLDFMLITVYVDCL